MLALKQPEYTEVMEAEAPAAAGAAGIETEVDTSEQHERPVAESSDQPAAKKAKVEGGDGEAEAAEDRSEQEGEPSSIADVAHEEEVKPSEPVKLGYKLFQNGRECLDYFKKLLSSSPKNCDMNEVGGACFLAGCLLPCWVHILLGGWLYPHEGGFHLGEDLMHDAVNQ